MKIGGTTVCDPANNVEDVVAGLPARDGKIVATPTDPVLPRDVFEGGELVVEQGEGRRDPSGRTLHVAPGYDEGMAPDVRKWFESHCTIQFANCPVGDSHLSPGGVKVECQP